MRWTTRDGAFILNWLDHRQIKGLGYYDTVVEASKDHNGISRSLDSIKRHVRGIAQKCRKTDIDGSIFDLGTSCLDLAKMPEDLRQDFVAQRVTMGFDSLDETGLDEAPGSLEVSACSQEV